MFVSIKCYSLSEFKCAKYTVALRLKYFVFFFIYEIELNKSLPKICQFLLLFDFEATYWWLCKVKTLLSFPWHSISSIAVFLIKYWNFVFGFALSPLFLHFNQINVCYQNHWSLLFIWLCWYQTMMKHFNVSAE